MAPEKYREVTIMSYLRTVSAILVLLVSMSAAIGQTNDDPELNFDYLWNALDRNYAQFGVKNVDWDALYKVYRPLVTPETTDDELYDIMMAMMGHLNDTHVGLTVEGNRKCVGLVDEMERNDFSLDLVISKYLKGEATRALEGSFTYGWLTEKIGYLHIADFKDGFGETAETIDAVIERFSEAEGLVVDVRFNPGGNGRAVNLVADRFADRKRHYMTSRTRYGREHDDLGSVQYWNVEPRGPIQFTRPTILLTHRFSESAADNFILAMRVLPHVTVAGDLSAGAFSSQYPDTLPNGWTLWVAFKEIRDHNGFCWDGIGVPPDLRIRNTKADIDAGTDRVLQFAIRLLEKGDPAPQEEPSSLENLKSSLVREYAETVEQDGLKSALAALNGRITARDDDYYLSADEIIQLSGDYLRRGKFEEAIAILRICREQWPQLASTYVMLAHCYLNVGEIDAARAALDKLESVEPMLPWEVPLIERVRYAYLKQVRGSAAALVKRTLTEEGIDAAEEEFETLRSRGESGPVFDEAEFNNLGYTLLQQGELDASIFVFRKNVQLHPDSWNAYDSLAEAFANAGRKDLAIENYRKSLELNPNNENGRAVLEQLEGRK